MIRATHTVNIGEGAEYFQFGFTHMGMGLETQAGASSASMSAVESSARNKDIGIA